MIQPYTHQDDNGNELVISYGGPYAEIGIESVDGPFRAFPEDLSTITANLYQRTGLPSPLIIERPEIAEGDEWGIGLLRVSRDRDRLTVRTTMDGGAAVLGPAAARAMAAVLAALADEAEAEPDPAEVDDLAHAIRLELYPDSDRIGLRPSESDQKAARAALRWMNAKRKHA